MRSHVRAPPRVCSLRQGCVCWPSHQRPAAAPCPLPLPSPLALSLCALPKVSCSLALSPCFPLALTARWFEPRREKRLEVAAAAVLVHAAGCKSPQCPVPHCNKMKKIHTHFLECQVGMHAHIGTHICMPIHLHTPFLECQVGLRWLAPNLHLQHDVVAIFPHLPLTLHPLTSLFTLHPSPAALTLHPQPAARSPHPSPSALALHPSPSPSPITDHR